MLLIYVLTYMLAAVALIYTRACFLTYSCPSVRVHLLMHVFGEEHGAEVVQNHAEVQVELGM